MTQHTVGIPGRHSRLPYVTDWWAAISKAAAEAKPAAEAEAKAKAAAKAAADKAAAEMESSANKKRDENNAAGDESPVIELTKKETKKGHRFAPPGSIAALLRTPPKNQVQEMLPSAPEMKSKCLSVLAVSD